MTVRLLALGLLCTCCANQVRANPVVDEGFRAPWQRKPAAGPQLPRQVSLRIEPGSGQETRLIIPARMLKDWRAAAAPRDSRVRMAGLGSASLPTVVTGLALTAAFAGAGLWWRRPRLRQQLLGGVACLLAGMIVFGVSCSPQYITRTYDLPVDAPAVKPDGTLAGEVLLEKENAGNSVRLQINRAALAALAPKPPVPANP